MRIITISSIVVMLTGGSAQACIQMSGYDLASGINNAVDYLICLHNEQVGSINDLADVINRQADRIDAIGQAVLLADDNGYRAAQKIDALENRVFELERKIAEMLQ